MNVKGKERFAVEVMKTDGRAIMCHDDKICYRAQKTGTGGAVGLGLTSDYWRKVESVMRDGKPIVTGYWNRDTGEHKGASWADTSEGLERLRAENGWKETTKKEYTSGLPAGVCVTFEANQVDMRLANLYDDIESRYRNALDYVASMAGKIVRYEPKVENPTDRNIREAMRNRLKRSFKPVEYEHNTLFLGQVGRDMMRDLRAIAETNSKMHLEENTVYLEGWKKTAKQKYRIKYYDVGARDGVQTGEVYKLEVTFLKEYFVCAELAVEDLKEQPEIQEEILSGLAEKMVMILQYLPTGGETMTGIQYELGLSGVQNPYQVTGAVLSSGRTLTERVQALEKKMSAVERLASDTAKQASDTAKRMEALETKGSASR